MRAKFKVLADALLALDTWELRRLCEALTGDFSLVYDDTIAGELHDALLDFAHEASVPHINHAEAVQEQKQ